MFLNIYLVLSMIWLGYHAFNWSSRSGINFVFKMIYSALAIYAVVVVCKLVIHV